MRYKNRFVKGFDENDSSLVKKLGQDIVNKNGNLFRCEKIVDENPYETPMMIFLLSLHWGKWVDYNLMTSVPGYVRLVKLIFLIRSQWIGASANTKVS